MARHPAADYVLASCADLLIRIVRAIKPMQAGQILEVVGYSRAALHDIPSWCRMTRNPLLHVEHTEPAHFFIGKGER